MYLSLTAASTLLSAVLSIAGGFEIEDNEEVVIGALSAFITPAAMVNAVYCILKYGGMIVLISLLVSIVCSVIITVRSGAPLVLKGVSLGLSSIMIAPAIIIITFSLILGPFSENTVVKTVTSQNGTYYAEVIASSQGALGGDTLVEVYKKGIDNRICKIVKKKGRVYWGEWGEFDYMVIYWKNDECLVINSKEYNIN